MGLITTWNTQCGIGEYSRFLAAALAEKGVTPVILGNYPVRPVRWGSDGEKVYRFFYTGWHDKRGVDAHLLFQSIEREQLEILHLQYETFLYPPPFLSVLRRAAQRLPVVVTFHGPDVPADFPCQEVACAIVHTPLNAAIIGDRNWRRVEVIPMGFPDRALMPVEAARERLRRRIRDGKLGLGSKRVLCSFGDRTKYEAVFPVVEELLEVYPDLIYIIVTKPERAQRLQESIRNSALDEHVWLFGEYLPVEELFTFLYAADVLLLYYPEFGAPGVASSAARLAIAARRPVILTAVELTRDLPAPLKIPFGDLDVLKRRIIDLFEDDNRRRDLLSLQNVLVARFSWEVTAQKHLAIYRQSLL